MILIYYIYPKIMTLANVSGTVEKSATVEEMSATLGEMSTIVGEMSATAGDMSSTVKTFNMFLKILEWRLSFIALHK